MVSIVVPCYNCQKTFDRCIESIRQQTSENIEIVLVDDGSTDKTRELCEKAAQEDQRIKVIRQKNGGLMNAWKKGVIKASGEYIAFCDSDDYIDDNLVEVMEQQIEKHRADIFIYGMKIEYSGEQVVNMDNRLAEGYYSKEHLHKYILPHYFSDGAMQSEIITASRCAKLFKREILMNIMGSLNDQVSVGEDDLTTFAAVLEADSIYCMHNYHPYHYMRNNESMIGRYDKLMFDKYLLLKRELYRIAKRYQYPYVEQIEAYFLSNVLLCMKKEISRNSKTGYRQIKNNLIQIRENPVFVNTLKKCDVTGYNLKSKVFANLVIKRRYFVLFIMTTTMSALGIGKP